MRPIKNSRILIIGLCSGLMLSLSANPAKAGDLSIGIGFNLGHPGYYQRYYPDSYVIHYRDYDRHRHHYGKKYHHKKHWKHYYEHHRYNRHHGHHRSYGKHRYHSKRDWGYARHDRRYKRHDRHDGRRHYRH